MVTHVTARQLAMRIVRARPETIAAILALLADGDEALELDPAKGREP